MKKRKIRSLPDGALHEAHVDAEGGPDSTLVEVPSSGVVASVASTPEGGLSVLTGDASYEVFVRQDRDMLRVWVAGEQFQFTRGDVSSAAVGPNRAGPAEVKAPMPGKVVKLLRAAGETVESGEGVILFEAMKMQNEIRAPFDGILSTVDVVEGQAVETHQLLFGIEPNP